MWNAKWMLRRNPLPHPCSRYRTYTVVRATEEQQNEDNVIRLVLYYKPGCESCDILKRKVKALIERAKFVRSKLSYAVLEVRFLSRRT